MNYLTAPIRPWVDALGLSYKELSRRTGIGNALIGRWAAGNVSPTSVNLELLVTKGFQMDFLTYMAGPNPKLTPSGEIDPLAALSVNLSKETVMLKVYSKFTDTGFGEPDGEIEVPVEFVRSPTCVVVPITDRRMEPRYPYGGKIFLDEALKNPQSQKVILCLLDKKPVLARWIKENRKYFLVADNPAWQPQRIEIPDDANLIVLGTVVMVFWDAE